MSGSMHLRVRRDRLTKVAGPRRQQVTIRPFQPSDAEEFGSLKARSRIDLRGQRVDEALAGVTKLIDEAMAANLSRVEIVHGKGTGALRQAIHDYLENNSYVKHFEDAPWDQGGPGVTYVYLA